MIRWELFQSRILVIILGWSFRYVDPQTDDISYSSEAFNPMKFLLEIHNNTSLQNLEKGLSYIVEWWISF